jgi:hypothetical protein
MMKRLACTLILILALTVPSLSFGAEPQWKQGTESEYELLKPWQQLMEEQEEGASRIQRQRQVRDPATSKRAETAI